VQGQEASDNSVVQLDCPKCGKRLVDVTYWNGNLAVTDGSMTRMSDSRGGQWSKSAPVHPRGRAISSDEANRSQGLLGPLHRQADVRVGLPPEQLQLIQNRELMPWLSETWSFWCACGANPRLRNETLVLLVEGVLAKRGKRLRLP
jgi:hypothetical protein